MDTSAVFADAQGKLERYYAPTNYVRLYDQAPPSADNTLTLYDILMSRMIDSGIGPRETADLYAIGPEVNVALPGVPAGLPLWSDFGAELQEAVKSLVNVCCGVSGIKIARTTKVLHKKRPALLPIVDSVVELAYASTVLLDGSGLTYGAAAQVSPEAYGWRVVQIMHLIRQDLDDNWTQIGELCGWLEGTMEITVTPLRLLDVLIWSTYSLPVTGEP